MRRVPKRSRLKLADLGEETTYGRVPNVNERTTAIMIIINGLRLHVPSDREPRYDFVVVINWTQQNWSVR